MEADIKGCLNNIEKAWKCFEHRGKPMTKINVINVLRYADSKGYKSTGELTDEEVDKIVNESTLKN